MITKVWDFLCGDTPAWGINSRWNVVRFLHEVCEEQHEDGHDFVTTGRKTLKKGCLQNLPSKRLLPGTQCSMSTSCQKVWIMLNLTMDAYIRCHRSSSSSARTLLTKLERMRRQIKIMLHSSLLTASHMRRRWRNMKKWNYLLQFFVLFGDQLPVDTEMKASFVLSCQGRFGLKIYIVYMSICLYVKNARGSI